MSTKPGTLGELRSSEWNEAWLAARSVKQEIRENLLARLAARREIFPGVHGYEDSVIPQIINALLARHNFILLGLRGQAKSRLLRGLMDLLDAEIDKVWLNVRISVICTRVPGMNPFSIRNFKSS